MFKIKLLYKSSVSWRKINAEHIMLLSTPCICILKNISHTYNNIVQKGTVFAKRRNGNIKQLVIVYSTIVSIIRAVITCAYAVMVVPGRHEAMWYYLPLFWGFFYSVPEAVLPVPVLELSPSSVLVISAALADVIELVCTSTSCWIVGGLTCKIRTIH